MKLFIRQVRKLDKFVVLTKEDAGQWPELQNVVVIPNKLSFLSDEVSTLQHKTVVAVGRYAWQKGFDRLISIWSKVASSHPDWQLCIYARGDRKLSKLIMKDSPLFVMINAPKTLPSVT